MARIALADLYNQEPHRQALDVEHILNAGLLEAVDIVPWARGDAIVVRLDLKGWRAKDDGIVSVVQRLHLDHWLGPRAGRVVAGPLAKWAFLVALDRRRWAL